MATNPDITPYTDLKIYDKSPQDLVDAALITLQARLPEWTPTETNLEMAVIEGVALEVSESIYAINRLPEAMVEVLLTLYGVTRGAGSSPTVNLLFTMSDDFGYIIPAGTEVSLPISSSLSISFFTDVDLTIPNTTSTGTVSATSDENVITANGIVSGTVCSLVDSVVSVLTVETASIVTGGVAPELTDTWLSRGVQRLQRLTSTLVLPTHFTNLALEQAYVNRANTIDNFDISLGTGVPGDHPGHVSVVVYGFGANVSAPDQVTLQSLLSNSAIGNIGVHVTDPTITLVDVTATVKKLDSYTALQVETNITDALQVYLDPDFWAWSGTVRVNELITLISSVAGVEYLVSMTTPAADIVIGTDSVLAQAGTLTITVT